MAKPSRRRPEERGTKPRIMTDIGPSASGSSMEQVPHTGDQIGKRLLENFPDTQAQGPALEVAGHAATDQEDRQGDAAALQPRDEFQPVDPGHAVVDDEAAFVRQILVGQQRLRPWIDLDPETLDLQGELERAANGIVVIHDQNDFGITRHHSSSRDSTGGALIQRKSVKG